MTPLRIELFGSLRVGCGDTPVSSVNTSRLQSLFAYLVLHCNTPLSRERLAFLLWPDSSEPQARTNLRQLLHHLRRALPPECRLLASDHQTVQWLRDASCSVDVWEFDQAVARGALDEAANLYSDDLLTGLYDDWIVPVRSRYRDALAGVLHQLALNAEQRLDFPSALRHAERLVAHDPLREAHHQLLIRLYAAADDRAGALRAYHQCMRLLRRELGVEPGAATRELFERVLKSGAPTRVAAEAPPTGAAAPQPMVGRRREQERLRAAWSAAASGGLRWAVILGEPGIGKSRLAEELLRSCARDGLAVARTRCYAGQGQVAFAPIAAWLRSEPLRAACAKVTTAQRRELARVLPEILDERAAAAPAPLADHRERLMFYESLNAAFGHAPKPMLLVIDDLQWCDADSFEWLDSLRRSASATQILVLGTARPEEVGRQHPLTRLLSEIRQSGELTEIALTPLDVVETAELAAQVKGASLPEALLAELYRGTQGNPLFVVESLRAGLGGATPARIHAVIAARLAQLSKPAYELVGLAAAVGRSFSFDLLAKATDWDEGSLNQALDELWQRRIIAGTGEEHGAAEYDFTHDRLREVAYQELGLVRRRFLHRRLARATEGQEAQVAAHYQAAGMAAEAIDAYCAAAAAARARYADTDAADLLRRALVLCGEFPENARRAARELELLVELGPVLVTTQGYATPEVGQTYARALELSRQSAESRHRFAALSGSWVHHIVRGRIGESQRRAEEFRRVAAATGDPALKLASHFVSASSLFHLGRLEESLHHVEAALAAYAGPSQSVLALFAGPDLGVSCGSYLGHILWHLGRREEGERAMERTFATSQTGRPFSIAIALNYRTMMDVFRGNSAGALAWSRDAAELCRKHQFVYYLAIAEILGGWAIAMEGDTGAGIGQLRKGIESFKATGSELRLPFYYALLAEAQMAAGRPGEAMANVAGAVAYQSRNGEVWAAARLERVQRALVI